MPETASHLLLSLQERLSFTHIIAPSSAWGKTLLPRAAAMLDVQPVSDAAQVIDADTFVRPIHAGNAFATVRYTSPGLRMITVRGGRGTAPATIHAVPASELASAVKLGATHGGHGGTERGSVGGAAGGEGGSGGGGCSRWVGADVRQSLRPELAAARAVVCGGRAFKSAENFLMIDELADALGGAVGASRAAVDAGYCANDLQVGQTGKVVAPVLYVGIGISGAIQHLAGMKDAKTIVAINTDPTAPLSEMADYALSEDLFTAVPLLILAIKEQRLTLAG
ncbi:MAG: hypothetical protein WDW38_010529 [Sanguina aurantia]